MEFDVLIVGGGPAGLSAAVRLRQVAVEKGLEISVCVIEKGSEIGSHILSGAVFDPRALDELIPDWKDKGAPLDTPVAGDRFIYLTEKDELALPVPPGMKNHGNYIISMGSLCRWLADMASNLGAEIFPGFAASEVIHGPDGRVKGVATGDMGLCRDGSHGPNFEPGIELHATYTLFAEGCRGSLGKSLFERFNLDKSCDPQTYAIGIKELWEVRSDRHHAGQVIHTIGWPLGGSAYGGSFIYHLAGGQVAVGLIAGLDYQNPYLSPFDEMQRFKTHPVIRPLFEDARRISYGARALNEGGLQSIPELIFPGGALIGADAGMMNVARMKGSHTAMKSAMLAADAIVGQFVNGAKGKYLSAYSDAFRKSWVWDELYKARNIRPSFSRGLWPGMVYSAIDTFLLRGHAPWTLHQRREDHKATKKAQDCERIDYPRPDGKITFDKLSSVFISGTHHREDQPCHLILGDADIPVSLNLATYDGLEQRFCPAGVYEFVDDSDGPRLQINAANCLHCKTCEIKDPSQNITWAVPEGGGGPDYPNM